jgi:integrase/recombinase XerD
MARRSNRPPNRGTPRNKLQRPAPVLPLALVVEEYARDLRRRELATKTIRNYLKILSLVVRCWETQLDRTPLLDDFTLKNAEAFLDALHERGKDPRSRRMAEGLTLSPETLRTYVRTFKAFGAWLADPKQHYTHDNRMRLLPMPKPIQTYKLPLTIEEIQALIGACDVTTVLGSRDLAMLLTLIDGGLRAAELMSLQVGHANTEAGQIFIAAGKGRKSRQVTVGGDTKRQLQRYAFLRDATSGGPAPADAPFFQTDDGKQFHYDGLRTWLGRLKARAGVPRAFLHLLRHTSAVQTLEVPGSDLFTLQAKLGHSDIATTRKYLRMTGEQLSRRQRTFSPIDHLGLDGLMRLPSPRKLDGRLWHRRVPFGPETPDREQSGNTTESEGPRESGAPGEAQG